MKFRIADFNIEEFCGLNQKESDYPISIINEFEDSNTRERIRRIFENNEKHFIRYTITENGKYVGEVTFRGEDESKPEIGIEIEDAFRNRGIGFQISNELMIRLSEIKKIQYFVYMVRYDNLPSIRLAEKLRGVKVKIFKPSSKSDFALLTYHIPVPAKKKN